MGLWLPVVCFCFTPTVYDAVVVGAGPAGLQVANYLQEQGRSYVVLEKAPHVGQFLRQYPRARKLISFNKVHNLYADPEVALRWDWNSLLTGDAGTALPFRDVSKALYPPADALVEYLERYASARNLTDAIRFETEVLRLEPGSTWQVVTTAGTFRALSVVWAGGNVPAEPDIPGAELAESYATMAWDEERFAGKKVLVVGKGNAALEVADLALEQAKIVHLVSPRPIQLAWNTRHPGHARANHFRILDMYQLKMLHGMLDARVLSIEPPPADDPDAPPGLYVTIEYSHADGETETLIYDHVVLAAGFRANLTQLANLKLAAQGPPVPPNRFPQMTSGWESTDHPGLFFAGTLMQAIDFKRSSSAFVGGFRYNCRALARLLDERLGGSGLKWSALERSASSAAQRVSDRVNRASGLWDVFGFLGDALVDQGGQLSYLEELPLPLLHERLQGQRYWTVNFEWGNWTGDVMNIQRHPSKQTANTNKFLHPVVRGYHGGEQVSEHHILEDLFATYRFDGASPGTSEGEAAIVYKRQGMKMEEYHAKHHWEPLLEFFVRQLERPDAAVDAAHVQEAQQAACVTDYERA